MKSVGIVPSRLAASRFPRKPMAKLHGMPMIGHCYFRTKLAEGLDDVYVATCDQEISDYIHSIGGKSILTSNEHSRASTRTAEALELIEKNNNKIIDIVVMVQGDEPMISPKVITKVLESTKSQNNEISNGMSKFHSKELFENKNNVKVVVNRFNEALYFSREAIPSPWKVYQKNLCYNQTGIIAFKRKALLNFNSMNESELEKIESVDMNRILENGGKIQMVPTDIISFGVDTYEDLIQVEKLLKDDPFMLSYNKL